MVDAWFALKRSAILLQFLVKFYSAAIFAVTKRLDVLLIGL